MGEMSGIGGFSAGGFKAVRKGLFGALTVASLAAMIIACGGSSHDASTSNTSGNGATSSSSASGGSSGGGSLGNASSGTGLESFSGLVDKAKPAVVQITTQQIQLDQANQPYNVPQGVGTGVIYDSKGLILTNNHVVEGGQQILVSLTDGRSMEGKVLGTDPRTDLAVVQIQGSNFPTLPLGDSSKVRVGDWTIAIGNALALPGGPTVTEGVASAVNRTVQEPGSGNNSSPGPFLFGLIQTSAPINPGNSGGPLIDIDGNVIGINTLVLSQAEPGVPAQGIGFAISSNQAKLIADQLVSKGSASHAYLGISYVPLTPSIAAQIGTQEKQGVVIVSVVPGGPAAQAGIQSGDVVTGINGTALDTESRLAEELDKHQPGETVTLNVMRKGDKQDKQVKLTAAPSS